jgi:myo-inositol 2-dehydrogenase / D-chiro-inositol 1-dehydrogenase
MKKPLNIAIVGCGALAQNFYKPALKALEASHSLELRAVADLNLKAALELQKAFPKAQVLKTLDDLNASWVDLAIVASPPHQHANHVKELFKRNIHVLCEKPLALNTIEALSMIDTAKHTKNLFAVSLVRRFFPAFEAIDYFVKQHTFGKPLSFTWFEGHPFSWPIQSSSLFEQSSGNKGVLQDLGVHSLDLMLKCFGYPVGFASQHDAYSGVDTNALLHLSFEGGIQGEFRFSWDTELRNSLQIVFEKARLEWFMKDTSTLDIYFPGLPFVLENKVQYDFSKHPLQKTAVFANDYSQSFVAQLANVCEAIRGETSLKIEAQEALQVTRLLDEAYKRAEPLAQLWINLDD